MVIDPKLDLVLERTVDVSPDLIWTAWTRPEHLIPWFAPTPWTTVGCEIDLRPGGIFRTILRSPEGENFPGSGTYLEIFPNRKLVWTNALGVDFRPALRTSKLSFLFTAVILLEPQGLGTKYQATVLHADEESRAMHEALEFHAGWDRALEQLVAYVKAAHL